jgi:hypothetical protein
MLVIVMAVGGRRLKRADVRAVQRTNGHDRQEKREKRGDETSAWRGNFAKKTSIRDHEQKMTNE